MARTTAVKSAATATEQWLINMRRAGTVYDLAGHSLGGGERIRVTELDTVGQAAVSRGYLLLKPIPAPAPEPDTGSGQ